MFDLTKEQLDVVGKFLEENRKPSGAIGGQFSYIFTPTSLGIVCKIKDNIGGEEIDLTDYFTW